MLLKEMLLNSSSATSLVSSDRSISRHSSNNGSTIEFDMFGTTTKIFVPDAAYRPSGTTQQYSSIPETWYTGGYPSACSTKFSTGYIIGYSYNKTTILNPIPTDDELKSFAGVSSICTGSTGTSNLAKEISGNKSKWASTASQQLSIDGVGSCILPNIYEMCVIWCEADNIDALDPTADSNSSLKLGYTNSSGRFSGTDWWTCNLKSNSYTFYYISSDGYVGNDKRYNSSLRYLPIIEL